MPNLRAGDSKDANGFPTFYERTSAAAAGAVATPGTDNPVAAGRDAEQGQGDPDRLALGFNEARLALLAGRRHLLSQCIVPCHGGVLSRA